MRPRERRLIRSGRGRLDPFASPLGSPPTIRRPRFQLRLETPPRLLNLERDMLAADKHWRLAFNFVQRQGWRFENAIERDEQIAECFLKMCAVLPKWRPEAGALSTFLNQCFFRHLATLAKRRGAKSATVYLSAEMAAEIPGRECEPVEYLSEGIE